MTERTKAHRCARCDINWPLTKGFAELCPICGFGTWVASGEIPLSLDEARIIQLDLETARAAREAFDAYYHAGRHLLVCDICKSHDVALFDDRYTICPHCDGPGDASTLDELGWDSTLDD
jgi:hypothetical protein